ncbi:MAG: CotH kinase family protein [Myxococcota bacterium]|nr:CotH kinase family protein [Myxococcota bacterium]
MKQSIILLVFLMLAVGCDESSPSRSLDSTRDDVDAQVAMVDGAVQVAQLVINEVVYTPAEGEVDWIEFMAIGDGEVNLSEYRFVDDKDDREAVQLPDLVLESGGFYVMTRGEGPLRFNFGLGQSDGVRLSRMDTVVDRIDWGRNDAQEGQGYGRLPDGVGEWTTTVPTPGAANVAAEVMGPTELSLFSQDQVISVELLLSDAAWQAIRSDPLAEEYQTGSIVIDGQQTDDVAIRVKGNSTLNSVARSPSDRYSFKVDINRNVSGQTIDGIKKLNFNNGFKDPTLMREHLGYDLIERAGMYASKTSFVDLSVAGQHMGVYTMVEQVDDDYLQRHFGEDGGDLYKPEMPAGRLTYLGDSIEDYRAIGVKNNEDSTDHEAFLRFIAVLNGEQDGQLDDVLNVDAVLRNLALNTVMVNLDSYLGMGHNFYLYEQDGRFLDLPWDLNETYGNFTCSCNRDGLINLKIDEPTCGPIADRPLVATLLNNPSYLERYHDIIEELIEGPASADAMSTIIDETAQLIRPFVEQDTTKFFSTADFERGLTDDVSSGRGGGAWGLKSFIRDRNNAIRRQLGGMDPSTNGGNGNCASRNGGMMGQSDGAQCPPCGDGICDNFETRNPEVCPRDCREPPANGDWCGDGICDALENCEQNCPIDCQN